MFRFCILFCLCERLLCCTYVWCEFAGVYLLSVLIGVYCVFMYVKFLIRVDWLLFDLVVVFFGLGFDYVCVFLIALFV